jgi:hypothetical protein
MSVPRGILVLGAVIALACGLPTEQVSQLQVDIKNAGQRLVVGQRLTLTTVVSGAESADLRLRYVSSDDDVVRVDAEGGVLATGVGEATVSASLLAFEQAGQDSVSFVVVEGVAIDEVSPTVVRFGEVFTMVGTALNPDELIVLAVGGWPAPAASYTPADPGVPASRDTLRVFTPTGSAVSSKLVVLHRTGGSASWPMTIVPQDLYEPNDSVPARLSAPFAIDNPQLAFEPADAFDWYRLVDITGSFTVEVKLGLPLEGQFGRVTLAAPRLSRDETLRWGASDDEIQYCRGLRATKGRAVFVNDDATDQVLSFPILDPAFDSVDVIVELEGDPVEPVPYQMAIREGYVSDFPPDAYEENDYCEAATPLTSPFSGSLSIDSNSDADWFSFSITGGDHLLTIARQCVRCASSAFVDVTVFRDTVVTTGAGASGPSRTHLNQLPIVILEEDGEDVQVVVPPGDYFLLVHNEFYRSLEQVDLQVTFDPVP